MKKLISMVQFVIEQNEQEEISIGESYCDILNYAKFLKQPLTLGMFIPCDLEGNVLREPKKYASKYDKPLQSGNIGFNYVLLDKDLEQYQQAKERVLFEGFEVKQDAWKSVTNNNGCSLFFGEPCKATIEDLVKYNLTLSENNQKSL